MNLAVRLALARSENFGRASSNHPNLLTEPLSSQSIGSIHVGFDYLHFKDG